MNSLSLTAIQSGKVPEARSVPPRAASGSKPAGHKEEPADPKTAPTSEPQADGSEISEESILKALEKSNQRFDQLQSPSVRFEYDEESGKTRISVVDRNTNEVIRFIPPDKLLKISDFDGELRGLLINSQG